MDTTHPIYIKCLFFRPFMITFVIAKLNDTFRPIFGFYEKSKRSYFLMGLFGYYAGIKVSSGKRIK